VISTDFVPVCWLSHCAVFCVHKLHCTGVHIYVTQVNSYAVTLNCSRMSAHYFILWNFALVHVFSCVARLHSLSYKNAFLLVWNAAV
jgi:FtsH-binding integral membrane protein